MVGFLFLGGGATLILCLYWPYQRSKLKDQKNGTSYHCGWLFPLMIFNNNFSKMCSSWFATCWTAQREEENEERGANYKYTILSRSDYDIRTKLDKLVEDCERNKKELQSHERRLQLAEGDVGFQRLKLTLANERSEFITRYM